MLPPIELSASRRYSRGNRNEAALDTSVQADTASTAGDSICLVQEQSDDYMNKYSNNITSDGVREYYCSPSSQMNFRDHVFHRLLLSAKNIRVVLLFGGPASGKSKLMQSFSLLKSHAEDETCITDDNAAILSPMLIDAAVHMVDKVDFYFVKCPLQDALQRNRTRQKRYHEDVVIRRHSSAKKTFNDYYDRFKGHPAVTFAKILNPMSRDEFMKSSEKLLDNAAKEVVSTNFTNRKSQA